MPRPVRVPIRRTALPDAATAQGTALVRSRNIALRLLGASAVAASLLLWGCGFRSGDSPSTTKQPDAIPVKVVQVVQKSVPLRLDGIGNVETIASVAVKSRVDGQILRVHFGDGAHVSKGEVLFEIDPRPALAQLKQTEANLARDLAQLQRAREQDQRYQDLLRKNFISPDAYEQIKASLAGAEATVQADRAAVENARLQVEYCTIRAPISGRVGKVLIAAGNLVKANDTAALVTLNQLRPIYVRFSIPERYLDEVRRAMASGPRDVAVTAGGADGAAVRADGRLSFVDNSVDAGTGTVKLRATVANTDEALWPGQFVHTVLTLGEQRDAKVVPSAAVLTGPKGTFVYVVDPQSKAQLRDVAVERLSGQDAVISKGLAPGESVVVDGQSRLLPGSRVKVTAAPKAS